MGSFVTFEGPEGGGKSSVCNAVIEAFNQDILLIREPGSTSIGEKIRTLLQTEDMPDRAELMLFETARACIVDNVISPALLAGRNVLCDRFYDSTTAYQGYGRGLPLADIAFLNNLATKGLAPDLTIIFDVDPVIGLARNGMSGKPVDRIEMAGNPFHERVRNGYLAMAKNEKRFKIVDASVSLSDLVSEVCIILESTLAWKIENKGV